MTLEPEDSAVVRSTAEDVRRYTKIALNLQVALVAITAVVVVGIAVALYFVARDNKRGVDRIVSCTTEGYECYEEQQARTNALVATFLVQLNQEHISLKCLLKVPPAPVRSSDDEAKCDQQAAEETDRILKELTERAKKAAEIPHKKEGE